MSKNPRFIALAIAVLVNTVALAAMHTAMGDIAQREFAAQSSPERIVVTAHKQGSYQLAARSCPTPKTL